MCCGSEGSTYTCPSIHIPWKRGSTSISRSRVSTWSRIEMTRTGNTPSTVISATSSMRSASSRSSSSTRVSIWITIVLARCILMYGVLERKISTNEPGPSATTESGFHSSGTIWSAARSCGTSPNAGRLPICVVSDDSISTAVSWTPRLWSNAVALRVHPPSSAHVERLVSNTLTSKRRANAASIRLGLGPLGDDPRAKTGSWAQQLSVIAVAAFLPRDVATTDAVTELARVVVSVWKCTCGKEVL